MANVFITPRYIYTGDGALKESMGYMATLGKKALIVTDDMMIKLKTVETLTKELDAAGIAYEVYSEINSEPVGEMIDKGVEVYKETGCDFAIGIGGGSPMDAAKAIATVVVNGGKITDYLGKKIEKDLPPVVAIPTTAGTGSEATKVSIITNQQTGVKMLLNDPKLYAEVAVVDPVFTMTAPPAVTAATGVDAFCHALESYTSRRAFPMTEIFSVSAIKRVFKHLHTAYVDGSNVEARREMAIASLEAGVAFSNASVTIIHGMSRPIGALFHVPHGLSNAMLLKVCLPHIRAGAPDKICQLAKEIGVFKEGMTVDQGADAFVDATFALLKSLNIQTPAEFGVDKEEFFRQIPKMTTDGLASGSPNNTMNIPTPEEVQALYKKLWD